MYKARFFLITLLLSLGRSGGANVSFRLNESVGKIIAVYAMVVRTPWYSYNSSEGNPASLEMARCVSFRIRSTFLHSDFVSAEAAYVEKCSRFPRISRLPRYLYSAENWIPRSLRLQKYQRFLLRAKLDSVIIDIRKSWKYLHICIRFSEVWLLFDVAFSFPVKFFFLDFAIILKLTSIFQIFCKYLIQIFI